jgi:dTDP-4-dehydrorhamnose reductase
MTVLPQQAATGPVTVHGPSSAELDVCDGEAFGAAARSDSYDVIVHAAAFTDVAGAESRREACWRTNVVGTRNAAAAAAGSGALLVHISTDYVFWGDTGGYREDDTPGPVRNYYALTKLVAEEAARSAPRHLVVRTSFRPRTWPYPEAFADVYTSQDYVDIIAPEIALAIVRSPDVPYDTLHIGTPRKSVLELARRRAPDVRAGTRHNAAVALPADVSLDLSRWTSLKQHWERGP